MADIINLVHNLDCYELHPGVTDDETLGRIYVEDMELLDVPDNVLPYLPLPTIRQKIAPATSLQSLPNRGIIIVGVVPMYLENFIFPAY